LNSLRSVEAIDDLGERPVQFLVPNGDFRKALDQVETRASGVESCKDERRGRLIGSQQDHENVDQDHENVDKEALVVGPARDEVADQRKNERMRVRRSADEGAAAAIASKSGFGGS
jgi:hypothetical protein